MLEGELPCVEHEAGGGEFVFFPVDGIAEDGGADFGKTKSSNPTAGRRRRLWTAGILYSQLLGAASLIAGAGYYLSFLFNHTYPESCG